MEDTEARERDWKEELEDRKRHRKHPEHEHNQDIEPEQEEDATQLAIEPSPHGQQSFDGTLQAAPNAPPQFQATPDPLGRSLPEQPIAPTVNIIPESYSENV